MDRWRGRVALVTGAKCIGAAIVESLALKGMKVITCDPIFEPLEELAKKINQENHDGRVFPRKCDFSDMNDIKDMFHWIENELGKVDVCICTTDEAIFKPLSELTPDEMKDMMNNNVISTAYCTQLCINLMLKKSIDDGQILFISSTNTHQIPDETKFAFHSATQDALKILVQGYRQELRSMGKNKIRIGSISLGFVTTVPHLEANHVCNVMMQILAAKPHVQIHDVILRNVHVK